MLYREAGQFKTSYEKDAAIFPILQDRIAIALVLAVAFVVVPLAATPYVLTGILIPFLIFSLAAIGLNILTGYAGQLSLGTAAFMAVGAFATYNFILRIPGIYASDRVGGTPRERLEKGTPVLDASDDVYTNHIHADDLARAVIAALWRGRPQRAYNTSDDSELKMGDYFDLAADLYGLPRPPRVPRSTAQQALPLGLLSFMGESRRLDNARMKKELRVQLRHPTVHSGLRA
jgi:hypothetical protein